MSNLAPRQPHRPLLWPDSVLDVHDVLQNTPDAVYLVGGAVRDALLGRPLHDIDLAVPTGGMAVARRIANHLGGVYFTLDAERDVGRAIIQTTDGQLVLDVARFRGTTLADDLLGRDFTVNAMAVDAKADLSQLIDPLGGERDLQDKILRRCAPNAISDDPVRALRAVRQSVGLGFRLDAMTAADCRANAPRLVDASPERIRDEVIKTLALPKVSAALRVMQALGILPVVFPETLAYLQNDVWSRVLQTLEHVAHMMTSFSYQRTDNTAASFRYGMVVMQLDRFRPQLVAHFGRLWPNERPHRALVTLAVLLRPAGLADAGEAVADRLRLSNDEKQTVGLMLRHWDGLTRMPEATPLALHRFWRQTGVVGVDVCVLMLADTLGREGVYLNQDGWLLWVDKARVALEAYWQHYEQVVAPPPLLDGRVLMKVLKLKPGPAIGELLESIREAQVTGDVTTQDGALDLARRLLEQSN